jgi:Na+(H+)/acetate symporter ActP
VQLSLSNVRRRRQVTCHSCGTKLEIVVPTALYSLVTLSAVVLGSMLVPVLLMSIFEKKWAAIALAIALLFALIFGSNELLNRRATVQRADARTTTL